MQFGARGLILLICYYRVTDDTVVPLLCSVPFGAALGLPIYFEWKLHRSDGLIVNKQWLHQQTWVGCNVRCTLCIRQSMGMTALCTCHIRNVVRTTFFGDISKVWLQTITTLKMWSCLLSVIAHHTHPLHCFKYKLNCWTNWYGTQIEAGFMTSLMVFGFWFFSSTVQLVYQSILGFRGKMVKFQK